MSLVIRPAVAVSPDGKSIVSGSYDETIRVWNADGTFQYAFDFSTLPSSCVSDSHSSPFSSMTLRVNSSLSESARAMYRSSIEPHTPPRISPRRRHWSR